MKFTNKDERMTTNPKLFAIADTLSKLTTLEAKQLKDIFENEYGIKGQSVITPISVQTPQVAIKEQTEFDIYLKEIGGQKLYVVKKVNECLRLGLRESKELVDKCPCLLAGKISKYDAQTLKTELENVGAVVEIR